MECPKATYLRSRTVRQGSGNGHSHTLWEFHGTMRRKRPRRALVRTKSKSGAAASTFDIVLVRNLLERALDAAEERRPLVPDVWSHDGNGVERAAMDHHPFVADCTVSLRSRGAR